MKKLVRKYRKSKGFTLVELLIVIIIIGILAGMMMLSSGSATDKAEATKIVSDLRNIKSAALMYYADKGYWPGTSPDATAQISMVESYLDQKPATGYALAKNGDSLYATYTGTKLTTGVKEKLDGMKADAGLKEGTTSADYNGGTTVGMIVRK